MTDSTCSTPDCDRPSKSRGMCFTHYSAWYRANRKIQAECQGCGKTFPADRPSQRFCSHPCANKHHLPLAHEAAAQARLSRPAPAPKPDPAITQENLRQLWRSQRSPARAAYEDKDYPALIEAIKAKTIKDGNGCWVWQGKTSNPNRPKHLYPVLHMSNKNMQVHRMMCEAKYGKPLGSQHAHHKCGQSLCVNPEHLAPATHAENAAEMMARKDYVSRIKELEAVVREIAPDHPVLDVIPLASVA